MSVKGVNFRGYKTGATRKRRAKREGGAAGLVEAMRFVGMSDEEIKAQMEAVKAERKMLRDRELNRIIALCTSGAHEALLERAELSSDEFLALARRAKELARGEQILRLHVEQAENKTPKVS